MAENNTTASLEFTNESTHFSFLIIPVLGAIANVLLLVAFIEDPLKCFRNSGTYLVMNLSVSDCLPCLLYPFLRVDPKAYLIYAFLILPWLCTVSLLSITSISIDRFLIVAYPLKYRTIMTGKVMVPWLAAIWIVSCVFSMWAKFSESESSTKIGERAFLVFSVILIIISSVMYSSTYYKLKKQSRNIALQNSTETRAQEIRMLKEKRFLKTIIIIQCITFVCVAPSMIFFLIVHVITPKFEPTASFSALALPMYLLQINFAVNPLIYFLRLPNYRKTFYAMYCRRIRACC